MKNLVKINSDVFGISKRLKQIHKNYFIIYNKLTKKFEIHFNKGPGRNSFELSVANDNLDSRIINLVLKSEKQNKKLVVKQIDEHNEKLKQRMFDNVFDESAYKLKEIHSYSSAGSKDYIHNKSYKNIWT